MKKQWMIILAMVMAMVLFAGCSSGSGKTINPADSTYDKEVFQLIKAGEEVNEAGSIDTVPTMDQYLIEIGDTIVIEGKKVVIEGIGSDADGCITINGGKDGGSFLHPGYTFEPVGNGLYSVAGD